LVLPSHRASMRCAPRCRRHCSTSGACKLPVLVAVVNSLSMDCSMVVMQMSSQLHRESMCTKSERGAQPRNPPGPNLPDVNDQRGLNVLEPHQAGKAGSSASLWEANTRAQERSSIRAVWLQGRKGHDQPGHKVTSECDYDYPCACYRGREPKSCTASALVRPSMQC
jgi:hypothetical protein